MRGKIRPGRIEIKSSFIFWGLLLFAILLKYGYYGFKYFPVLDDNNMYGVFHLMTPSQILVKYPMYTVRPLASLLDIFFISRLWDNLTVVLILFTLIHFFTCCLIYGVFKKNGVSFGQAAAVIFTLVPLNTEAAYWIAASSRLVTGSFFTVLSLYLLSCAIDSKEKKPRIWLWLGFGITNLISLCFYEQISAVSFACALLLLVIRFKRLKPRWIAIIPFINLAALAGYYKYFGSSANMTERGQLVHSQFLLHSWNILKRIYELLATGPAKMLKRGLLNGLDIIIRDSSYLYLAVAIVICIAFGFVYAREKAVRSLRSSAVKVAIGLLMIIMPFAPFFALQSAWIANRNTFIPLVGIGLVAEALISLILGHDKLAWIRGMGMAVVSFVFIIGNVSELTDYKNINRVDHEIVEKISDTMGLSPQDEGKTILVLNTKSSYVPTASNHFANCTSSDWALTGAVRAVSEYPYAIFFIPVPDHGRLAMTEGKVSTAILLGIDEQRNVYVLTGKPQGDGSLKLYTEDGLPFGSLGKGSGGEFYYQRSPK